MPVIFLNNFWDLLHTVLGTDPVWFYDEYCQCRYEAVMLLNSLTACQSLDCHFRSRIANCPLNLYLPHLLCKLQKEYKSEQLSKVCSKIPSVPGK